MSGRKLLAILDKTLAPKFNYKVIQYGWLQYVSASGTDAVSGRAQFYSFPNCVDPVTADLLMGSVQATAFNAYDPQIPVRIDRSSHKISMKNASDHCCEILLWKCWPRRDMLIGQINELFGLNPQALLDGFAATTLPYNTSRIQEDDADATPYMSQEWTNAFKLSKPMARKLMPGEEIVIKMPRTKLKIIQPTKYGYFVASETMSANYRMLPKGGPSTLLRARGCIVHNQAGISGLNPTPIVTRGPFRVEWIEEKKFRLRGQFFPATDKVKFGRFNSSTALSKLITQTNAATINMPAAVEQLAGI